MRIFLNSVYELFSDFDIPGDTMLVRLLNDQITQLHLNSYVKKDKSTDRHGFEVFGMILSVSKQLRDLNLSQYILNNVSNFNLTQNLHIFNFD